jgi:hypothetical protein
VLCVETEDFSVAALRGICEQWFHHTIEIASKKGDVPTPQRASRLEGARFAFQK